VNAKGNYFLPICQQSQEINPVDIMVNLYAIIFLSDSI